MSDESQANSKDSGDVVPAETRRYETHRIPDELDIGPNLSALLDGLKPGAVAFHVPGNIDPIIIEGEEKIFLGRRASESDRSITVDLTDSDGVQMGVSRRHAALIINEDGFFVEDLGSTNGTFLNEDQLAPESRHVLHNGAQLRLGRLIVLVYFKVPQGEDQDESPAETTMRLLGFGKAAPVKAGDGVDVSYFTGELGPYLETLQSIQRVVQVAKGSPDTRMTVRDIDIDVNRARTVLTFANASVVSAFVGNSLGAWQKRNPEAVARLRAQFYSQMRQDQDRAEAAKALVKQLDSKIKQDFLNMLETMLNVPGIDANERTTAKQEMLSLVVQLVASRLDPVDR